MSGTQNTKHMNKSFTAKKSLKQQSQDCKATISIKVKKKTQDNLNLYNFIAVLGILKNITEGKVSV